MADLGTAYVNIVPKAQGISSNIENLVGGGAEGAGASAGNKVGSALLSTLGKIVSVAAVGKLLKDAFSAGGDLQQSFGGLETIYGGAAEQAKQFAAEAASAGISANSYAEQAVSFGASLKQAFGGDTTAAMQAANTAIMDMADNSAKMGTDIGSVQAAYQGFAKQNYTMLDNLKLGYGGTKTEMERLLADASALSGVEYNIDNLGDVYEAIHVIQGELGLTGVAAAEAETTLTGSMAAAKASFQNLLAAMTTGEGLDKAMQNFAKSGGNLLTNIMSMMQPLAEQLPTVITSIFTTIGPQMVPLAVGIVSSLLQGFISSLPALITGGVNMLLALIQGITTALPQLITAVIAIIPQVVAALVSALPQLIEAGIQLLIAIINGIVASLPQLIATITSMIPMIVSALIQNLPALISAGIQLLMAVLAGIIQAIPQLLTFVPQLFSQCVSAFASIDWASLGRQVINGIINGIKSAASNLFNSLRSIAASALESARAALGIGSPSKLFADEVGKWIPPGVAMGIEHNLNPVQRSIQSMVQLAASDFSAVSSDPGMSQVSQSSRMDYDRLANAINSRPIIIQGDTSRIFKVVRQENNIRTKATNYNALGANA